MNLSVRAVRRRVPAILSAVLLAGLLAGLLAAVPVVAAPAAAAEGCTDETTSNVEGDVLGLLGRVGCDDVTPPRATIAKVTPAVNGNGFVRQNSVRFDFTGAHTDSDTGTIEFECQFYAGSQPDDWAACTSPQVFSDLEEFVATPYTFRVRAVDADDDAIKACDAENDPLDPLCLNDPDVPDRESVGDKAELKVDTSVPNTFLSGEPFDTITPDKPVVVSQFQSLRLNSNEDVSFLCTLNGKALQPCNEGQVSLGKVRPGTNTFIARAVDRAGNIDKTPASAQFFVPKNIKRSKKSPWRTVREPGLFGNDYLTAKKAGQTVVVPGSKRTREVRILAPTGPTYGKIEVRVGTSRWYEVNLFSKQPRRLAQLLVRDEFAKPQAGVIQIRVKAVTRKRPTVRVDAIVVR